MFQTYSFRLPGSTKSYNNPNGYAEVYVKTGKYLVTVQANARNKVDALKSGAMDFLTKPIDSAELLDAVRSALARSEALNQENAALSQMQALYDALTPREREIMIRIIKGLLNKQIAYELGISEITVKAHRGRLMKKTGARSLPELMAMAARLNIDDGVGH